VLDAPGAARWRHAVLGLPRSRRVPGERPRGRARAPPEQTARRLEDSLFRGSLESDARRDSIPHSEAGPALTQATASNT
jgi:hypothetical protein